MLYACNAWLVVADDHNTLHIGTCIETDRSTCVFALQLKRKAREAGEEDAGVTLAAPGASEEEQESEQDGYSGRHDHARDDADDMVYEGGLTSSDDEEGLQKAQQHGIAAAGKAAYFGMHKKSSEVQPKEYEGLSVAEQEALALRMIKR